MAMVQAHAQELVVNVPAIGVEYLLPQDKTPHGSDDCVEDRNAESHNGNDDRHRRLPLHGPQDGKTRQHVAQEIASRIAEEDRRRVEVIPEEAEAGAGQGREAHGHKVPIADHAQGQKDQGGKETDPSGQTVQAVDEVHGVHEQKKPEDGYDVGKPGEEDVLSAPDGGDGRDRHAALAGNESGQDLDDKLNAGAHGPDVVDEAQDHDDGRAADQPDQGTHSPISGSEDPYSRKMPRQRAAESPGK